MGAASRALMSAARGCRAARACAPLPNLPALPSPAAQINEGQIEVDQSALTGESLPVTLFRADSAKMGSTVTRGEVEATVEVSGAGVGVDGGWGWGWGWGWWELGGLGCLARGV
jgi:hypothetical protein